MKKLLYIVPHLSTGGMPQYVLKQIEEFKNEFEIEVVEWENVSNDYVVQKNKIKNLVKVYDMPPNKGLVLNIIKLTKPDIIHFQEIPEHFIDLEILRKIYDSSREYFIIVTTHSSLTDPTKLTFLADKFILVNEWSKRKFEVLGIDCNVWEYPIETKPKYKKILNVGLFTPGKNQGEIFEIAKLLPTYGFHFIGNQAGNFKSYWEPLMQNKPSNCKIWGEQDNVEQFYRNSDIFYFSSKFELNPLVVKEALSYQLPVMMYKLETYLNYYDNNPLVHYINDLTIKEKAELIKRL